MVDVAPVGHVVEVDMGTERACPAGFAEASRADEDKRLRSCGTRVLSNLG